MARRVMKVVGKRGRRGAVVVAVPDVQCRAPVTLRAGGSVEGCARRRDGLCSEGQDADVFED